MVHYHFHLMNGFAERPLVGAAIAVVEIDDLDNDTLLQTLAYQLSAPETAFIDSTNGHARAYSPQYPLPASGHAALAIAAALGDRLKVPVDFGQGPIRTWCQNGLWHFQAEAPKSRATTLPTDTITSALSLDFGDITGQNIFVDTGLEQLLVPVRTQQAILKARPKAAALAQLADHTHQPLAQLVLWHQEGDITTIRSFISDQLNVFEDFGAGNAAANLAGWKLTTGRSAPFSFKIEQGHTIQRVVSRLSTLYVAVDAARRISVSGKMWKVGEGELAI